jgi:Rrf2 family iron-sulfur cluster assembly transcriptional regulator
MDMKLSTKGQYAVLAMVDLARHSAGDPVTLTAIAERQALPLQYLEQLFMKLRKGNLVKSVRGQGGGYLMVRPADQVTIAEIMLAVDEPLRSTRCEPGKNVSCQGRKEKCLTHYLWEGLNQHILSYLASISLAHICASPASPWVPLPALSAASAMTMEAR